MKSVFVKGDFELSYFQFTKLVEIHDDLNYTDNYCLNDGEDTSKFHFFNRVKHFNAFKNSDKNTVYLEQVLMHGKKEDITYHTVAIRTDNHAIYLCDDFLYFEGEWEHFKQYSEFLLDNNELLISYLLKRLLLEDSRTIISGLPSGIYRSVVDMRQHQKQIDSLKEGVISVLKSIAKES